jgi:NADH:ubiquinone oxidoreductase subunit 6 (subunit J)
MLNVLIGAACLTCAVMAIREKRLLITALWLALTSALVSWMMFRLGALEAAVVELSVGAGLVTVLFVFAINIAGDVTISETSLVPRPLAWVAVVIAGLILGWMILPQFQAPQFLNALEQSGGTLAQFRAALWEERGIDTLLQVVLIFAGVMAVLGVLGAKDEEHEEEKA